jgi:hypothetical protein
MTSIARWVRSLAALTTLACAGETTAELDAVDPFHLARLQNFSAQRVSSNNRDPQSNDDSFRPLPGETVVLADLEGPGVVSHLWITVAANEYAWPRLLRLRVYYDDSTTPSVDAPLGDFFGVGHGMEKELSSLVVRSSSSGRSRNSYWPMPFRRRVRITLTNEGRRRMANLYYHVDWRRVASLPANTPYFHARYRQALPARSGAPLEILRTRGRGHYVGTVLSVVQREPGWFGEGDDLFYVDGQERPIIEGTGTEDYVNDAWSLRVADGPYAGVTVAEGTDLGSRMTAYRWHLSDPIPFTRELRFAIEHAGWTFNADGSVRSAFEERPDLFSSVAFWYQVGVAEGQPEPPYGAARLPHGNASQIEVERSIDGVTSRGGSAMVQREVFWSKDIVFFKGDGVGSRVDVPFDVETEGRYEIVAQVAMAPDYGAYRVLLDGKPIGQSPGIESEPGANVGSGPLIDGYHNEVFVGEDRLITWAELARGKHTLTFVCTGKNASSSGYNLGLDALVLARVADGVAFSPRDSASDGDPADRIRRIGSSGSRAAGRLSDLTSALRDPAPEVREAAAWSLTQLGSAGARAMDDLARALEDSSHVVRGLAAIALRDLALDADNARALPHPGPAPVSRSGRPTAHSDAVRAKLIARLEDVNDGVRMAAAWAIAAEGAAARPAYDALLRAAARQGEHPQVQRAIADALGAIGAEARDAIPVLRELAKSPRVRWNAEAAIRRIEVRARAR